MTNYFREQIERKRREIEMQKKATNLYTIHPKKSNLVLLYEVVDESGRAEWGGAEPGQCMQWLDHSPTAKRVLVSAWESDAEDAHLVGQTLDITEIVMAARL